MKRKGEGVGFVESNAFFLGTANVVFFVFFFFFFFFFFLFFFYCFFFFFFFSLAGKIKNFKNLVGINNSCSV